MQYNFSVASITAALQKTVNKKRFVREERTLDKIEKFERKSTQEHAEREGSRSDSQASQAPSHLPMQQSSGIMGRQYWRLVHLPTCLALPTTTAGYMCVRAYQHVYVNRDVVVTYVI